MAEVSRRNLLTGWRNSAPEFRPPWSGDERHFVEHCTRCQQCVAACQTHVLTMGAGGFPKMDFDQAECTFCYACAAHCPENLFSPQSVAPWDYQLSISERCLAQRQVECRCCQDACEVQAIRFRPTLNGIARPEPDVSSCTTCGACIPACPVSAITLRSRHE